MTTYLKTRKAQIAREIIQTEGRQEISVDCIIAKGFNVGPKSNGNEPDGDFLVVKVLDRYGHRIFVIVFWERSRSVNFISRLIRDGTKLHCTSLLQ